MRAAENARIKVINALARGFSPMTSRALANFIRGIHFAFPDTKEEIQALMVLPLRKSFDQLDADYDEYQGKVSDGSAQHMILSNLNEIRSWSVEEFTDDLHYICKDYDLPMRLSDATYNNQFGTIKVSWQSVQNPRMGESVLVHEIGHATVNYFERFHTSGPSGQKYQDTLSCLNSMQRVRHSNREGVWFHLSEDGKTHPHQFPISQYTEEDWSDLVTAMVAPEDAPNMGCFFHSQADNKYSSLKVFRSEQEEQAIEQARAQEGLKPLEHPTDLFRVLHIEKVQKGVLPPACQEALEQRGIETFSRSCEL